MVSHFVYCSQFDLKENMDSEYYVHPMYIAIIHIGFGDKDSSLDWLEKGYQDRSEWMVYLQVEHLLDPLHGEDRFKTLIE